MSEGLLTLEDVRDMTGIPLSSLKYQARRRLLPTTDGGSGGKGYRVQFEAVTAWARELGLIGRPLPEFKLNRYGKTGCEALHYRELANFGIPAGSKATRYIVGTMFCALACPHSDTLPACPMRYDMGCAHASSYGFAKKFSFYRCPLAIQGECCMAEPMSDELWTTFQEWCAGKQGAAGA